MRWAMARAVAASLLLAAGTPLVYNGLGRYEFNTHRLSTLLGSPHSAAYAISACTFTACRARRVLGAPAAPASAFIQNIICRSSVAECWRSRGRKQHSEKNVLVRPQRYRLLDRLPRTAVAGTIYRPCCSSLSPLSCPTFTFSLLADAAGWIQPHLAGHPGSRLGSARGACVSSACPAPRSRLCTAQRTAQRPLKCKKYACATPCYCSLRLVGCAFTAHPKTCPGRLTAVSGNHDTAGR